MNNILHSIKLDYYILKSSDFRRILIIAAAAVFAGTLSKDPPLILGIIMTMSGFLMSTIFAVIEKNSLGKLYGILPVTREQTVIGRYLFTFFAGIAVAIVATILALIVSLVLSIAPDASQLADWLCGSFFAFSLLVSLQFPLYFKYDFSKLAALANLPYIVLLIGGIFLVKKYPQLFAQATVFFFRYPYMLWVIALLGAVLLLAISTFVSIALYKTREL